MSRIQQFILTLACLLAIPTVQANTEVKMVTTLGSFTLSLDEQAAPKTVENFVKYVQSGFYDGLIFHRVINGFMIQGGGFTQEMNKRSPQPPIANESTNGLSNQRGTIAMARTNDPDSATSQFFINLINNDRLDGQPGRPGYTVFGKVIDGMQVIDKIAHVKTTSKYPYRDVPVTPVIIKQAVVLSADEPAPAKP